MELYLVRHGETVWNREGRYYGSFDVGLSPRGKAQARKLGEIFGKLSFDKVYVSPSRRAVDTARELTGEKLVLDARLQEQNFGIFEGKTYREIREEFPRELEKWNRDWQGYCIPQGESFRMVRERVERFAGELWGERGRTLLVAHKGSLGHLAAALLHMPLDGYWNFVFEQGAYSRFDLEDGYAILRYLNVTVQAGFCLADCACMDLGDQKKAGGASDLGDPPV